MSMVRSRRGGRLLLQFHQFPLGIDFNMLDRAQGYCEFVVRVSQFADSHHCAFFDKIHKIARRLPCPRKLCTR
jgi:hypothetical protein